MERRAAVRIVFGAQISSVCLDDGTTDRETEAEPFGFRREKRRKYFVELVCAEAHTGIPHRDSYHALARFSAYQHCAFGRRALSHGVEGIQKEVQKHLLELHPVA